MILLALLACTAGPRDSAAPPVPPEGDPDPGWYSLDPLPTPLQEVAVLAVDDTVWVLGGFDDGLRVVDTVWIWDGTSWEPGPPLPEPAHHLNAAVVDGSIVIAGMLTGTGFTPSGRVWTLDPGEAGWAEAPALPEPVGAAATGALGTDVLLAGGLRGGTLGTAWRYDTLTGTATSLPDLPLAADHAVGVGGAEVLVVGGREGGIAGIQPDVYAWTGTAWEERAPMLTARAGAAGCVLADGRIWVAGGEGNPLDPDGVFAEVEVYDPAADAWTSEAPLPTPRHGTGAAPWRGGVLVPGGAVVQGFRAVDTVEWWVPGL
ncbi:MAG: kelch repeat-containing protein [Myxococcota bacterium]